MIDEQVKFYFNLNYFLVYNKFTSEIYVIGEKTGHFDVVSKLEAFIFSQLHLTNTIEGILNLESVRRRVELNGGLELKITSILNKFLNRSYITFSTSPPNAIKQYDVIYNFISKKNEKFALVYKSEKTQIASNWARLNSVQNLICSDILDNGIYFFRNLCSKSKILEDITSLYDKILNFISEGEFVIESTLLEIDVSLDQSTLNKLHELFEVMYTNDLIDKADPIKDALRRFNMNIHLAEEACSQNLGGIIENVYQEPLGPIHLSAIDKTKFSTDLTFGMIYLNYLQIGHSLIGAFESNSETFPSRQNLYNANHFLCFRPDYTFSKIDELKEWSMSKFNIDLEAENWCLGHIPLAKLEVSDKGQIDKFLGALSDYELVNISVEDI